MKLQSLTLVFGLLFGQAFLERTDKIEECLASGKSAESTGSNSGITVEEMDSKLNLLLNAFLERTDKIEADFSGFSKRVDSIEKDTVALREKVDNRDDAIEA